MAVTVINFSDLTKLKIAVDATSNGTGENDVILGAANLFLIEVDNTANAAVSYTKLYNTKTPTIGTTAPDVILETAASTKSAHFVGQVESDGKITGLRFDTAVSFATVTAGGTGGTTSPGSAVPVRIIAT